MRFYLLHNIKGLGIHVSIVLLLICSMWVSGEAQSKRPKFDDGPYIFKQNDSLLIQWSIQTEAYDTLIEQSAATTFDVSPLPVIDLQALEFVKKEKSEFDNVSKIAAISDVHGQYDIMIQLLRAQKVIDEENNWIFGDGHLVIVGDNFDRGDKVMDILWLLFQLEKEAEAASGALHVLLGNHEIMVLNNDLRYLHKKYIYTSALFKTRYDQMFRKGSILGDWLSSQNVAVSINNNLFVHGGISTALLGLDMSIDEINTTFIDHLIRREHSAPLEDERQALLYYEDGPIWYRGYFDSLATANGEIDSILTALNQEALVIGHTSLEEISSLHNGKVIGIDCSIKLGKSGQALIIENDKYYVGDLKGKTKRIQGPHDNEIISLFGYLYDLPTPPEIRITTDISYLIKHGEKEEYQKALLEIIDPKNNTTTTLEGRARTRGNIRKQVCRFPPIKYDFSKSYLDSLGFVKNDKLKLVLPCTNRKHSQVKLYQEYFLYGLYQQIDSNGLRAKLLDITIEFEGEEKFNFDGMLVEDEDEYAYHRNAKVVEKGKLLPQALHRSSFLKMLFFQYMISNTDWAVSNKHNLEFVKLPNVKRVVALPYDFDYSGFVDQSYAVPHESLPIENVTERYFMPYKIKNNEFKAMVEYFLSIETKLYNYCDTATYMSEDTIRLNKRHLKSFFDLLRNPDRLRPNVVRK